MSLLAGQVAGRSCGTSQHLPNHWQAYRVGGIQKADVLPRDPINPAGDLLKRSVAHSGLSDPLPEVNHPSNPVLHKRWWQRAYLVLPTVTVVTQVIETDSHLGTGRSAY